MPSQCRSENCKADIVWCQPSVPGGKAHPVNPGTAGDPAGRVEVWREGSRYVYRVMKAGEEPAQGHWRYVSHWATCPDAKGFRKRDSSPQRTVKADRTAVAGAPAVAASDDPEEAYRVVLAPLAAHIDCVWEQTGRCVYCKAHGVRLGQGRVPTPKQREEVRAECARVGLLAGSSQQVAWPAGSNGEAANR